MARKLSLDETKRFLIAWREYEDKDALTVLVECNQGICGCCICCFYDKNTHIIKEINKVILYIESNSNSNRKTVNCELYMVNGEKKEFFKNWRVKEENLNELEAFFRRHFDIQIVDVKEQKAYTNK